MGAQTMSDVASSADHPALAELGMYAKEASDLLQQANDVSLPEKQQIMLLDQGLEKKEEYIFRLKEAQSALLKDHEEQEDARLEKEEQEDDDEGESKHRDSVTDKK